MSLPPNKNLLKEFPNRVYVETGIWRGDSIQQALDAGFQRIIGIDNDPDSISFCENRFDLRNNSELTAKMNLTYGDSAMVLSKAMFEVDEQCTILLDAHWQMVEGTPKGEHPFPLMLELEQLVQHPIKRHTIIIDDLLYMTHPNVTKVTLSMLVRQLYKINPQYMLKLIANPVVDNMLVAYLE